MDVTSSAYHIGANRDDIGCYLGNACDRCDPICLVSDSKLCNVLQTLPQASLQHHDHSTGRLIRTSTCRRGSPSDPSERITVPPTSAHGPSERC